MSGERESILTYPMKRTYTAAVMDYGGFRRTSDLAYVPLRIEIVLG